MSDFKDRLVTEHSELSEKIEKLSNFLESERFSDIDKEQQELLKQQYQVMLEYQQILIQRIKLLQEN